MDSELSPQTPQSTDIRFEAPTFIDPLTGLFNRYYLYQFLPEEIKKASLNNYPLALLMVDLDGFKKINDTQGHLCGDKVLTQVSEIIKKTLRQTDTVARYAGDEFVILLPAAGKEKTPDLCNRLISEVEKATFTGDKNQDLKLTLSIGYAIYPEDATEEMKLIDTADKALYLSKKRGRNLCSSAKEVTVEEISFLIAMDSFPCPKFINQKQELDKLKDTFSTVVQSNLSQAVFITGMAGVGKSRIINEIRAFLQGQGICIFCNAFSSHTQDPYYLFAKGIGAYIDTIGIDNQLITDLLLKVPLPELAELSLVIPQLRNVIKESMAQETDYRKKRFLLFKAFVDFLIEMNRFSPILITFDDIQWADKASLELLRYLIKQENKRKLFIICTFSVDSSIEKIDSDTLQMFMQEFRQDGNVTNIKLGNLTLGDTAEMIDAIFANTGKLKEFVSLVYDATKGNPSFIEEMLKSLVEKGIIFYQNDTWQIKQDITGRDIPTSLEEIIKGRIKNLDDETKEMIIQAAVIGQSFQIDVLKNIGDKNEGFIAETINRAKKMRLVDELGTAGGFNFINKDTQNILYNQLSEEQRNRIHYKIAQVLANRHKGNLYNVAGEVAFHFGQAPQQEEAATLSRELLRKTTELFDPLEVTGYLAQLTRDLLAREEKVFVELSDKMMKEATKFIILLLGAIKKFRLYPSASFIRLNTAKELNTFLSKIFTEVDSVIISEVEKSLVVNGRRLSPSEVKYTNAEQLLSVIMDHNIKTIALKSGIQVAELSTFIHYLSQFRRDVIAKGGWVAIIKKEGLEHIGIDEIYFTSVSEYSTETGEKKRLQDLMLMEFLLGKVDHTALNKEEIIYNIDKNPDRVAQTIMEIANVKRGEDKTQDEVQVITNVIKKINSQILGQDSTIREHVEGLSKIILSLEPQLRNRVLRSFSNELDQSQKNFMDDTIGAINDDFMIDIILEEYKNNIDNPFMVKEFINSVLVKEDRRKRVLTKLEPQLSELGNNKQDIAFVSGKIEWKDLPLERRTEMLLGLPNDYYAVSALGKINSLLEELDSPNKKEELKNFLSQLLIRTGQVSDKARNDLLQIISDFIKEPFINIKEGYPQITNRLGFILEKIENETDTVILAYILEISKKIMYAFTTTLPESKNIVSGIENPVTKRCYLFIDQLFFSLNKRFKKEALNSQIRELIKNFILDISSIPFMEMLTYRIIDDTAKNKYDIKDIHQIIGEKLVDTLINLATKKRIDLRDPFKEFLVKKRISNLLVDLKDAAANRIKSILCDKKEELSAPLIELIGYLKNEEMIDLLLPFTHHREPIIRIATVLALTRIGGQRCIEILSRIAKEDEDDKIRDLANSRLQKIKDRMSSRRG